MIASYAGTSFWQQQGRPEPTVSRSTEIASGDAPVNPLASASGTHLIAFVVTASDCGWSSRPTGMEAIRTLRAQMRSVHGGSYAHVSVVGVALDADLDAGLKFLSDLGDGKPGGAFDQVIVGGSWLNEHIVRFVWRDRVAQAGVPQVIVIERPIDAASYVLNSTIAVQDDKVVANPFGTRELVRWIRRGMPLNTVRTVATAG